MQELKEILKDFNPKIGVSDNIVSDIFVLSIIQHNNETKIFGYIEDLTGKHSWIKLPFNDENMNNVKEMVKSQVALRTRA